MRAGIIVGVLAFCLPAAAMAQEEDFDHTKQYSHHGQFGVHAQGGLGFRFIAPYKDDLYCGQLLDDGTPKRVCSERSPISLSLGASYGVSKSLELLMEVRFGLEQDFGIAPMSDGPKQLQFAPGLKIYIRDAGLTKFFSSLQLLIDTTEYDQVDGADIGLRNVNGLQFDFHRTVGVYFFFGEAVGFKRWFEFELDAGVGMQIRVP